MCIRDRKMNSPLVTHLWLEAFSNLRISKSQSASSTIAVITSGGASWRCESGVLTLTCKGSLWPKNDKTQLHKFMTHGTWNVPNGKLTAWNHVTENEAWQVGFEIETSQWIKYPSLVEALFWKWGSKMKIKDLMKSITKCDLLKMFRNPGKIQSYIK